MWCHCCVKIGKEGRKAGMRSMSRHEQVGYWKMSLSDVNSISCSNKEQTIILN